MKPADSSRVLRQMRPLLGTLVEVGVVGAGIDGPQAVQSAFQEIDRIGALMSFQDPGSELSCLNRSRGGWVSLSGRTVRVLRLALAMTRASGGLFNCTIGGAMIRRGWLPDHDGAPMLPVGDERDVELRSTGARLRRPVRVTLDGIAKGFAVDIAMAALLRVKPDLAWVNAGGDLRVAGSHALPVRIRGSDSEVQLQDAAVATSASERYHDADRPGEILDAISLRKPRGEWTVVAARAWRADALTKVAALAPAGSRIALVRQLGGRLLEPGTEEIAA